MKGSLTRDSLTLACLVSLLIAAFTGDETEAWQGIVGAAVLALLVLAYSVRP